ncbi:MAG: hypothetical protein SNJ29_16810 [Rikenellaceae bacterium]
MEHYIYVMDYSVGTILFFTISNPDDVECELCKRGYKHSTCSWMLVNEPIEVEQVD